MSFAHKHNGNNHNNLHVLDILNEMRRVSLENAFICHLMEHCQRYEGLRDLMELWFEETSDEERAQIVADLQETLDDIMAAPKAPEERPYFQYEDLKTIQQDVHEFKTKLREEVDRQGGVSVLARKTGIPQPSLSRFFSSDSMPRRTTLYKIAKALNLPESAVGFKWTR